MTKLKDSVLTIKLEQELRDAFAAEAEAQDRPVSQVMRELMRDYIQRSREERAYGAFLRKKVETGRRQIEDGLIHSDDEVEAEFSARRGSVKTA